MKKDEIQRIIEREIMCSDLYIDISYQRQAKEFTKSLTDAIHQALSMSGVIKSVCDHDFIACGTKAVECTKCKQVFKTD